MTPEEKKIVDEYFDERYWLDSWECGITSLEWNGRDIALREYYRKTIKPILEKEKLVK